MTVREVYDYLLAETNKVEAPSILLDSFNYYFGKSINDTCSQWYTFYELNQLLTDNLRVLTRSTLLTNANISGGDFYQLPSDYWHLLPGGIVNFEKAEGSTACDDTFQAVPIKLDSQMKSGIFKDYYTKPSFKRPYLYMHEFHNTVTEGSISTTTIYGIEIKAGDKKIYKPTTLYIDYLKKPLLPNKTIKETDPTNLYLTYEELDSDIDISATLEFPENYCYEIIKKLTALVLEQTGDPRLQNNIPLNQTMVPPRQG